MADYAATITDLGDKIANLKLSEAAALKEYLKEKYKIEPAAGSSVASSTSVNAISCLGVAVERARPRRGPGEVTASSSIFRVSVSGLY